MGSKLEVKGETVCFWGRFEGLSQKDIAVALRSKGARIARGMGPKVTLLFVAHETPESMEKIAKNYNVRVASGTALRSVLGDDAAKAKGARQLAKKVRAPRAAKTGGDREGARLAYWKDRTKDALLVWSDALSEAGDERGEFIALHLLDRDGKLTGEQRQRLDALHRLPIAKRIGPAAEFIRQSRFEETGLVNEVICEARRFIEGFHEILKLNPALKVEVTSLRSKRRETLAALKTLPLGEVPFLSLARNALTDAELAELAPALRGIRMLDVSDNPLTSLKGLVPAAEHIVRLQIGGPSLLPPAVEQLSEALLSSEFSSLQSVYFSGYNLPNAAALTSTFRRLESKSIQVVIGALRSTISLSVPPRE